MRRVILKRPHLTEKAVALKEIANQVTFEVAVDANKIEIRRAIEQTFKVGVRKVATINMRGKKKTDGAPSWAQGSLEKSHYYLETWR